MSTTTLVEPLRTEPRVAAASRTPFAARALQIPLIRTLSSVGFGMSMLALILAYASFGSALPQVRGTIEMTEMQVFRHWLFAGLIGMFAFSLTLATVLRIRWRVVNAGVLTVHAGLLMLCFSAWWYFATKIEGDAVLLTPRVQISQASGALLPGGELAARVGEKWERTMPAFGGAVRVEVLRVQSRGLRNAAEATVRVQLGDAPASEIALAVDAPAVPVSDRLKLSLADSGEVDRFFDNEVAALHYRRVGEEQLRWSALEGLPYFRERFLDEGGPPIRDRDGKEVASKRTRPAARLAGFDLPTGWFEHWRMPLAVETTELPFDVTVTGYLPYIAGMRNGVAAGGDQLNPAAEIEISLGEQKIREWLVAKDAKESLLGTAIPFEFRWIESEQEREALYAPLIGTDELSVEVRDAGVRKTYAIRAGETIKVEGTPYEMVIEQLSPAWPLITPGFEGATSPIAMVKVTNGQKTYSRTVVQRFPNLSQDIDEAGMRRKDGPYDPNLVLHYRSAARGWFLLTAGPKLAPMLASFSTDGKVERIPLKVGEQAPLHAGGLHLNFQLAQLIENSRPTLEPVVEPLEHRRPTVGRPSASAIRLEIRGRGELAHWKESRWMTFSNYPHVDPKPIVVRPPGDAQGYEFIYSRKPHSLEARLGADQLAVEFMPGRRSVERWRSEFLVQRAGDETISRGMVQTNETFSVGRWTLFQSGAAQDHWSFTVLGVGNRNGIWMQVVGCTLIALGCLYAFYIKPILRRREQDAALALAGARVAVAASRNGDRNGRAGAHA